MGTGMIHFATAEEEADTTAADEPTNCAKPSGGSGDGDIAENDKKVFCFFSLNNEKEFQYVNAEERMRYQNEATEEWEWESNEDFKGRKKMLADMKNRDDVEIVEYYGADNKTQSVEERFKTMMEDKACDSLVLSGHHAEYFTGKQSIGGKNWKLDLNFMEEMSCQPGCEDWFENVKSLFLMGCNTVKEPLDPGEASDKIKGCKGGNTADCKATYVTIKRATDQNKTNKEKRGYLSYSIQNTFNQAYSSTLDQHTNPLSSRYLKIFRNSSLYGWSETAPGVGALSRFSIPRFIHMVSELTEDDEPRERDLRKGSGVGEPNISAQDIVNFLNMMNNQAGIDDCKGSQVVPFSRAFTASQWAVHWDSGTAPTSCYLREEEPKNRYAGYKDNACDLNRALNEKPTSTENVKTAVDKILKSESLKGLRSELGETGTTDERKEDIEKEIKGIEDGIRRNFNHLMNIIVKSKGETPPPAWHDEVKQTLQKSGELRDVLVDNLTADSNIGFTKKADYLYFYKQVYGDSKAEEDQNRHQQISNAFLTHLNQTYDQVYDLIDSTSENNDMDSVNKNLLVREYHALIRDSIVENGDGLANWLYSHQEKEEEQENRFDELIKKYKNPNLAKYLGGNILPGDGEFYSVLFNGLCYRLKESDPEVCKET